MSAAIKVVKQNKNENTNVILEAISHNKPITVRTFFLTKASQESLKNILRQILEKFNKSDSMDICYNSVKGLVMNATKANIKRVLFKDLGLDITNPAEYAKGMEKIETHLTEKNFHKFKDELMKQNLAVKTTFTFNEDMLSVTVKNNFILLPHEFQLNEKPGSEKTISLSFDTIGKNKEILQNINVQNPNLSKVVSLNQYKIDQQTFSQHSNIDTNETIIKLDIVLNNKNTFNTETFSNEMKALYSSYKTKFDQIVEGKIDEEESKKYSTLSTNITSSLRGKGDFLNQLKRIQNLDSQLYKEQQLLLANYGENVFKTIQDKLSNAKAETNEIIGEIKKVGQDVFEFNKNQIKVFIEEKDLEIEKQVNEKVEKHKKKIEEINTSLDTRIENQSMILTKQVDHHITRMHNSTNSMIETSREKITKFKEEMKTDLECEINIAELMKHDFLEEISTERNILEKSVKEVKEEIRKIENFHTNKEVMDSLIKQSDEAFWKMTSNIEVIKTKEESINTFMSNISLLETAIKNTEEDIKLLDHEKTDYLTEKSKMAQTIDVKIKQMEKFGEEVKQKLIEIAGFEKKLNIISGSLTEQVKKTKSVDDQLVKFSKEVSALESKKNELNHFVSEVDQKVALINSKTADIKMMESKFNHIESMMIDLSARHKQITTMENRLEEVKGNIELLIKQAEDKVSILNLTVQNTANKGKMRPKKNPPKLNGVVNELKENVLALKKKRLSVSQIAETLEIDEEMVTLILSIQ